MSDQQTANSERGGSDAIVIGWVIQPSRVETANDLEALTSAAAQLLQDHFFAQFESFEWKQETRCRRPMQTPPAGVKPLDLLEIGCEEKIAWKWDFAFVVSDADLLARQRPFTIGVPSSALETAVMTTARFPRKSGDQEERLAVMAQYFFGHMLGLSPHEPGAMRRPLDHGSAELERFDGDDRQEVLQRLADVADARLEERRPRLNRALFSIQSFLADPRGILIDVIGYEPWMQPLRLSRLTAAAFVSMLFLFFGAEAWEIGIGLHGAILAAASAGSVGGAAAFLYRGQNLHDLIRQSVLSEQLARSRVVLILSLLLGMVTLWGTLFIASAAICLSFPGDVIERWVGRELDLWSFLRFSVFTATLGTLAGALGGNLEDEDDFKAELLFDEEA